RGEPPALDADHASIRHVRTPVRLSGALRHYKRELATMSGKKKTDAGSGSANAQPVSSSLARAVSLHLEGKRKEALRELNTAIENGEQGADIYAAKGHIQFELEQYDDAVKTYEKLLGAAPQHPTANFNLGICYEKLGRWQEANLGWGICLLRQEKPEPAITCFDKVLASNPEHETAMFGKAVALQLLWK